MTSPDTISYLQTFYAELQAALIDGSFISLVLSKPTPGSAHAARQDVRLIEIQGELHLQWTARRGTQDVHENLPLNASQQRLQQWLPATYRDGTLLTTTTELQFRQGKRSSQLQRRNKNRQPPELQHNRQKSYLIPEGQPIPFLVALGVMTTAGQVKAEKQRKFRQLNRYLEFVNDIYHELPASGILTIVDAGCGLSYLTFALHYLLTVIHQREVQITGIDRNSQVISRAQQLADTLGLAGLNFLVGTIGAEDMVGVLTDVQLVVSLHACDTATDDTLLWAAGHRAQVILAVPCCQHQLAPQLAAAEFEVLSRHGILREQFSSLATDTLRAAALEGAGYATQVVEFIELEHTAKNLLLRAVRRDVDCVTDPRCQANREEYRSFKALLGVQTLATDQLLT